MGASDLSRRDGMALRRDTFTGPQAPFQRRKTRMRPSSGEACGLNERPPRPSRRAAHRRASQMGSSTRETRAPLSGSSRGACSACCLPPRRSGRLTTISSYASTAPRPPPACRTRPTRSGPPRASRNRARPDQSNGCSQKSSSVYATRSLRPPQRSSCGPIWPTSRAPDGTLSSRAVRGRFVYRRISARRGKSPAPRRGIA